MMIKGSYKALVEIDINIVEISGVRPFEDIRRDIVDGYLTELLTEKLGSEFGGEFAEVKVTQQYADLYRVGDSE